MADLTTDNLQNLDDLSPRNYLNDQSKFLTRTSSLDESITFEKVYEQTIDIAKSPTFNSGWNAGYITGTSIITENEANKDVLLYSAIEGGYINRRLEPNDIDWSDYDENDFVKVNSNGELVPSNISVTDIEPTDPNNAGKFLQVSPDGLRIEESDFDFDSLLNYPDVSEANANTMNSGIYVAGYSTVNRPSTGEQGYIYSARLRTDPTQTNPRVSQIFVSTDSNDIKVRRNSGTLGINDFGSWYTLYSDANHPISDSVSSTSSIDLASSNAVKIVNDKIVDLESRYNGSEILSRLVTVDGPGSELNADRLDGYHFSDLEARYANVSGDSFTGQITMTSGNKIRFSNGTSFLDIKADGSQSTLDSNNAFAFINGSLKQRAYLGGLLVSNNYTESSLIPSNGIYSKGKINSGSGFDVGNNLVVDSNGEISWNSIKDVPSDVENLGTASQRDVGIDPNQLPTNALIANQLLPSGAVLPFAGATPPSGWLACDGSEVSRSAYPDLYAYIGTLYGAGNGSTTFNLPDLRNQFVRGASSTRPVGNEENDQLGSHNHTGSTNTTGNHSHSGSTNTTGSHQHTVEVRGGVDNGPYEYPTHGRYTSEANNLTRPAGDHSHTLSINNAGNHSHSLTINNTGGSETRPQNIALLYCIKY